MNERKEAKDANNAGNVASDKPASKGDDVADPHAEVVEGEVISTEDDNK